MSAASRSGANKRVFRLLSYTLVFLMMACAVLTVSILVHNTLPGWHAGVIAGILLFIVLDRLYTFRHLNSLASLSSEWVVALGAQWILILVLTRFLLSFANGTEAFLADLTLFSRGYLAELFTGEFVVTLLLAIPAWVLPAQFLRLLDEIGLNPDLAASDEAAPQLNAVPAHQRLVDLIFSLGIVLVVMAVLTRINVRSLLTDLTGLPDLRVSRFSGAEAGVLFYFVFGLTLLSLSRLMSLQTHWNRLRIPVASSNLVRQWGIYSLVFLLILALIIGLLPAGNSLGFLSLLSTLFSFLFSILFYIGQLILVLIALLFTLPMLLLRGEPATPENAPVAPVFPTVPVTPTTPPAPNESWIVFRSILLWGILVVILVFAFVQFVRQHGGLRAALRHARVTDWLILAWQWIYQGAGRTRVTLSRLAAEGWESLVARLEGRRAAWPASFVRLRALNPRQRVYFFYLAMVRRGSEQGVARKAAQTPGEYAATLEKALPAAGEDIESITDAFVEARYSRKNVDAHRANVVKETWERIRRALRDKSIRDRSTHG